MKKNDVFDFLVGCSVNLEFVYGTDGSNQEEKGVLDFFEILLSGTSANVATAIDFLKILDKKIKLLALTSESNDSITNNLDFLLKTSPVSFTEYKILDKVSIGVTSDNKISRPNVNGKRGNIDESKIEETAAKILKEFGKWRIATSTRREGVLLAEALLNDKPGHRILNPGKSLLEDKQKFISLLGKTDMLIMNEKEFDLCNGIAEVSDLHQYGPEIIIITKGEFGGLFSKRGEKLEKYQPFRGFPSEKSYQTGAGDWFTGGLVVRWDELDRTVYSITLEELRECIFFASKVAAKKITMLGGPNGPTRADIE